MNPSLVQESSVAAPEIDQPEFADVLQMDQRMPARDFGRIKDDGIRGRAAERTTAVQRVPFAIRAFQPGFFLFGCVHFLTFYQELVAKAKRIKGIGLETPLPRWKDLYSDIEAFPERERITLLDRRP